MRDDLVFDIGLHKGEDAAFYLRKGYRVVGIEADPGLAAYCRQRFGPEISRGDLVLIEGAIVAEPQPAGGTVTFYKNPGVSVWGTIDAAWRERNESLGYPSVAIEVRCLDLNAIFREHGVPYYLKVDIEGADRICLNSLQGLGDLPRFLSMEDDKVNLAQLNADLDRLGALGYRRFRAVQQGTIPGTTFDGVNREGQPFTHRFEPDASGPFGTDLAGPWMTADELRIEYRWIYEMYALFGDNSPCARDAGLQRTRSELERAVGRPLPGWYDTHAMLG